MPEFTHIDLQKARKSVNMPQWKAANGLGVSESTLKRWEAGETQIDPDDVDHMEELYSSPGLWHRWMCSNCDSYRKRYKDAPISSDLLSLTTLTKIEMLEALHLHDDVVKSLVTGEIGAIDCPELKEKFIKEMQDVHGVLTTLIAELKKR